MLYSVIVAPPPTKKMTGKLVITLVNGIDYKYQELPIELGRMEFEVSDEYQWIYSAKNSMYGKHFLVEVRYTNESGNRKKNIHLVPNKEG